jgi:8-oxo-dGTP pyrophosphatase MutT (NUDIX family)
MGSANGGGVAPLEKAATLVLLRDAPGGFEVLLLKRHEKSGVAPGALVFPGGRVDLMDDEPELAPQLVRALASGGPATLQVTAIRETFEECAILLAREVEQTEMVSATRAEELEHYRGLLQGGDISLAQFLSRENLLLACDKLIHYANWVTPDFMPRRFDTHFFLAVAPPEQLAIEDGHESISVNGLRPAKAL